ncbi:MAG: DUF503 domain-containing protein [Anaerolineae bacterium]
MVIGLLTLELNIPASNSLKDKRQVVRSLTARLRHEFNISVAEVGNLEKWRSAVVAVACVSSDREYAHGLLSRVALWVERQRLDCQLEDYSIELI